VTAIAGYDALSHAVEAYVTTRGTPVSEMFADDAWRLLESHYERVLAEPGDLVARGAMLLGAHEAGIAIEQSMLGATHACANPLTAQFGTTHGVAVAVMLPHVVRWNAEHVGDRYRELAGRISPGPARTRADAGEFLARRLEELRLAGGMPAALRDLGVPRDALASLAAGAAAQWTGTFNPRPFDAAGALALYERAY
jgi:alcohol dehydrogenase